MTKQTLARVSMLVRASRATLYEAFVEPRMLRRFWLKRSSGKLVQGKTVTWEFKVAGASESTTGELLQEPERIRFRWSDGVHVEIALTQAGTRACVVTLSAGPFQSADEVVGATEGFSLVLADLKILLESGKSPNLVRDKAKLIAMGGPA